MNASQIEEVTFEIFEFVEFQIGTSRFGISITNVREIIEPVSVTIIPHAHPYVKGIIQLRGEVLPVIDLKKMTGNHEANNGNDTKYIVGEFSERTVVLEVSAVTQIERVKFTEIERASGMYEGEKIPVLGVIKRDDGMILLVDFEKVIEDQFD